MRPKKMLPVPADDAYSGAPASSPRPSPGARAADTPRVLLIAALYNLPYMVLRCATAAGANVIVLGAAEARGLRHSSHCFHFIPAGSPIDACTNPALIAEINRAVSEFSIDLVAAGDTPSTRSLATISHALNAPCFPLPSPDTFDLLNDKWRFTQLCNSMGIRCPESRFFSHADRLRDECRGGGLQFPFVAKPINQEASRGVIYLSNENWRRQLRKISYSPIITQDHIGGIDIGSSIFCRNGEIEAFLVHRYSRGAYTAYDEPEIHQTIEKLVRRLRLTGVYNFDMKLADNGDVYYLECNPRAFYKIAMSMLAGINFIALGLPWRRAAETGSLAKPVTIRFPQALLLPPWKFDDAARRGLDFVLQDPVPYLRERFGLERGR